MSLSDRAISSAMRTAAIRTTGEILHPASNWRVYCRAMSDYPGVLRPWSLFFSGTEREGREYFAHLRTSDYEGMGVRLINGRGYLIDEFPSVRHLGGYCENSAPALDAVCGVVCSTWDKPLRYVWDREATTCPDCLAANTIFGG